MRVLVTGGAGFIGFHIVEQLVALGHDVIAVDSIDPAVHHGPPDDLATGADWRFDDVRDAAAMRRAVTGVDAVCHLAARSGGDFGEASAVVDHNAVGTATLLEALHREGFAGRIVLASSTDVYGEGLYHCAEHGTVRPAPRAVADLDAGRFEPRCPGCGGALSPGLVDENDLVDPRTLAAATKLHQEHLCRAFSRAHPGATATALRFHNVYGPRMPLNAQSSGVAAVFRSQIERGTKPQVLEDGGQRRDFVHVGDAARATVLALTCDVAFDGPVNIGSGRPATLLEMATALCIARETNLWPEVVGGYRLGDARHLTAATARAQQVIGFRSSMGLSEGMRELAHADMRGQVTQPA